MTLEVAFSIAVLVIWNIILTVKVRAMNNRLRRTERGPMKLI